MAVSRLASVLDPSLFADLSVDKLIDVLRRLDSQKALLPDALGFMEHVCPTVTLKHATLTNI